jgi:large subunit ribosomal protein L23
VKDFILVPRISEKAYAMSQAENVKTYVMEVPTSSNKHSVARAVSSQFDVVVSKIRTVNVKGKVKQSYRKGSRPIAGMRSDVKKAYVTLRAGDSLPIFVEEAKEEAKQAKTAEKAAKKTKKESK